MAMKTPPEFMFCPKFPFPGCFLFFPEVFPMIHGFHQVPPSSGLLTTSFLGKARTSTTQKTPRFWVVVAVISGEVPVTEVDTFHNSWCRKCRGYIKLYPNWCEVPKFQPLKENKKCNPQVQSDISKDTVGFSVVILVNIWRCPKVGYP